MPNVARKPAGARAEHDRVILVRLMIVGWAVLGALVWQINQPENGLTAPWQKDIRPVVQTFVPEQWAFFTKSPQEEAVTAYVRGPDGHWVIGGQFPHSRQENAFGWNRKSRAQGVELGIVFSAVEKGAWLRCPHASRDMACLLRLAGARDDHVKAVANPSLESSLCGPVALVKTAPVPWAWRIRGLSGRPSEVAFVDVKC